MENDEKTEEMVRYENETGRQAIWQGKVTKGFNRWKRNEKNYYGDKKRISVYISREKEKKWLDFVESSDKYKTLSKLIREGVDAFLKQESRVFNNFHTPLEYNLSSEATYELKQKLTTIKGFLQLILAKYKPTLESEIITIVENVLDQTKELENKFILEMEESVISETSYDVLLIEDDLATVELLTNYFISKGISCKGVYTGTNGLKELKANTPKLILIDIILPDISGFDICKEIRKKRQFDKMPIIYLTAIPGFKVQEKMEETKADAYILKPFDLVDFEFLFDYL
jgi:CheY-like chemotaxis protein